MRYTSHFGKDIDGIFESSAELEELKLPKGEFVAKNCKAMKLIMLITSIISIVLGLVSMLNLEGFVGYLFLFLGICLLLVLPTIFSYKCVVNKTFMEEDYYVLFFKRSKKILWEDIKYKKIVGGSNRKIKLYDKNKKCLIVFDNSIVGFNRILKLVKKYSVLDTKG